jgi:hypothetical protein
MDRAEAIEHLLQIPRATVDVLNRIVAIADTKLPRGSRHELSEPRRASRTDCHGIEARFLPHQSQEEARGERVSRFCLPNEWLVQGFLEASIDMIRFAIWLAEIERSWVTVKRSLVGGEQRLELTGFSPDRLDWYKGKGCFTEIIRYRTRLFVPVSNASSVLPALAA